MKILRKRFRTQFFKTGKIQREASEIAGVLIDESIRAEREMDGGVFRQGQGTRLDKHSSRHAEMAQQRPFAPVPAQLKDQVFAPAPEVRDGRAVQCAGQ